MSAVDKNVTLSGGFSSYGNFSISTNILLIGTTYYFYNMNSLLTKYLDFKNVVSPRIELYLNNFEFISDCNCSGVLYALSGCVLKTNGYNVQCTTLAVGGGTIYLGNSTVRIPSYNGGYIYYNGGTIYYETSTIILAQPIPILNGSLTYNVNYNNLIVEKTRINNYLALNFTSCNNLKIENGSTVKFTAGTTQTVKSFTAIGTSVSPITLSSITPGSQFNIVKSSGGVADRILCNNIIVSDSNVTPSDVWYAGVNSVDNGNNTGWIFNQSKPTNMLIQGKSEFGSRIVRDGLVLYLDAANPLSYPLSGTTVYDISKNNNNGTLINGVGYDINNKGSFVFDGINDYIDLGNITLNMNLPWTIMIWVYLNSYNQAYPEFITLRTNLTNPFEIAFSNQTGYLGITFGSQSTVKRKNGVLSNTYLNKWTNVSLTYLGNDPNNANNFILYDMGDISETQSVVSYAAMTQKSILGGNTGASYNLFNGKISNVSVYSKALTIQEIQQNFNVTKSRYGL